MKYFAILSMVISISMPMSFAAEQAKKETTTTPAQSASSTSKNQDQMKQAKNHAQTKAQTKAAEKRKEVTQEAIAAMNETQNALEQLDKGNKDAALDSLRKATGKLEVLMTRSPQMGFAPFDVSVQTHDLIASTQSIKELKDQVISMLQQNRVQEARVILSKLSSETRINVASIPLATYPSAIKDAVKMIDQNKLEEAKAILATALSTVAISETIVPLPLLRSEFFVAEAQKLQVDSKTDKQLLMGLISAGRDELNMAQVLGYGIKNNFKDAFTQFDKAEKLITSGKVTDVKFDQLKNSIENLYAEGTMQAQENNTK